MTIVALAVMALALAEVRPAPQNVVSFCGFTVAPPPKWKVSTMSTRAGACEILLSPPGWLRLRRRLAEERDLPTWAIRLRSHIGGAEVGCQQYGLCNEGMEATCRDYRICTNPTVPSRLLGDKWTLGSEGRPVPVVEVKARGCRVFQATIQQRSYDKSGYRGMGEAPSAVIIAKSRVAIIEADDDFEEVARGSELGYPTFDALVKSLACR